MNESFSELISFLKSYSDCHRGCSKSEISKATAEHFSLKRARSVYYCPDFTLRFSSASRSSFSNVVLSLSALQKYDRIPFIVCVVRPTGVELLLANSTFLKKISHSSHQLRVDNVRGSFLGHDIMRQYEGVDNSPENFETLYAIHSEFSWEDNLIRLVDNTNAIVPRSLVFNPSETDKDNILAAPDMARMLSKHPEYFDLYDELDKIVHDNRDAILRAARIDNINLRGNTIEQIVTGAGNFHTLDDISRTLSVGTEVKIDIKTKILTLTSSPKGYNIDKVLSTLASGNTVVSFFFIGVNVTAEYIVTCLVSIFDKTILDATRIQFHWAGRSSRGVTQLTGDFSSIFGHDFVENIDVITAKDFLQKLIDLRPPS